MNGNPILPCCDEHPSFKCNRWFLVRLLLKGRRLGVSNLFFSICWPSLDQGYGPRMGPCGSLGRWNDVAYHDCLSHDFLHGNHLWMVPLCATGAFLAIPGQQLQSPERFWHRVWKPRDWHLFLPMILEFNLSDNMWVTKLNLYRWHLSWNGSNSTHQPFRNMYPPVNQ